MLILATMFPENKNYSLTENSPLVSVDVRLKDTHSSVDFDYDAYHKEAERVGLKPEAHSRHINIIKPGIIKNGSYSPIDGSIDVAATKHPNKTLAHELKHAADDEDNLLEIDSRYAIGKVGTISTLPLGAVNTAAAVGSIMGNEKSEQLLRGPLPLLALGVGSATLVGYFSHPAERRARKAGSEVLADPIILTEKDKAWHKKLINRYTPVVAMVALALVAGLKTDSKTQTPSVIPPEKQLERNLSPEQLPQVDRRRVIIKGVRKNGHQTPKPPENIPGKNPAPNQD